jgi:hypothetical protein
MSNRDNAIEDIEERKDLQIALRRLKNPSRRWTMEEISKELDLEDDLSD